MYARRVLSSLFQDVRFTLRQIQNPEPENVPEPSLVLLSLCGLGWAGRRLRSRG